MELVIVLIESDWNLKQNLHFVPFCQGHQVLIESDWNLKESSVRN